MNMYEFKYKEYKKMEIEKKVDYMSLAIKICEKLNKKKGELYNTNILEDAFYKLLDNPEELKSGAYNKLYQILLGLGQLWAEPYMIDLII